ncbi:MAG: hypothetical protein JRG70_08625, partial [Deltaproteobacteria bacterium]|nr:hypothetical protein [Deltaproteobacteria bacterium]
MTKRRFTPWIALACIGTLAACTSGEGGTAGNIDIETVEYTIACAGNSDTFLDNGASFADEVRIDGNLEVVDGRTNPGVNVCVGGNNPGAVCIIPASPSPAECQGTSPVADGSCVSGADFGPALPGSQTEVWQGFMDLPPGPCSIELRARDNDGEVICTAIEPFSITADTTTKVNLVLICDTSFQAPVGMLDVDATFSFNVGNFCPDLFVLNCMETNPVEEQVLPPPNPMIAATVCEVRFRDGDSTCGAGCDPQSCVPTATGLFCTPGPDPGVSTTITCNAATLLDCQGDGIPEASCTINGDTLGVLPEFLDNTFPCVTDVDCLAFVPVPGVECVAGFCDFDNTNYFLNLSFAVACVPPALGGVPGAVVECTAVTTDGDTDCDKTKVVQVNCPGLTPCDQYAADGFVCDSGTVCQIDSCNDALAVAGSCGAADNGACCEAASAPDATDCSAELPPLASCTGGVCASDSCAANIDCDDSNE